MSADLLDAPAKAPTFQSISTSRKAKNGIATVLFYAAFGIALIPLVWVLFTVIEKGWRAITSSGWWTNSLQGVLPEQFAGGIYHALYGTLIQQRSQRSSPSRSASWPRSTWSNTGAEPSLAQ